MKKQIITAVLMLAGIAANAQDIDIDARVGYNIGGTMPLGMPASIRGLNEYTPQANFQLGVDAEKRFTDKWGAEVGLKLDRKGMHTDAQVKNYHMTMERGGEAIEGVFTGNVVTNTSTWSLSIPVQATFHPVENVKIKAGPYAQLNIVKAFGGYAYDGYLRKGDPTGERIELGNTETERGEYEFDSDIRPFSFGMDFGVDWYIKNNIGVYADLTWGMTNAFKSSFKTIEQSMYPIYGTIGIMYKLK